MSKCKMCGCTNISGPGYEKVGRREGLRYVCIRCGYSEVGPTREQEGIENRELAKENAETLAKHNEAAARLRNAH